MAKVLYGVFSVERCWKLYTQGERAMSFASRQAAIAAGESAARSALARGLDVELYLQDRSGNFEQASLAGIGH